VLIAAGPAEIIRY